ncbi:MAG: EAL domain-containing protein [Mobilitalea sp.]
MKERRIKKLSTAFLLPIMIVVFVAFFFWSFASSIIEKNQMSEKLVSNADEMLNISAAAAEDAFWNYNDITLNKIGSIVSEYDSVAHIILLDEKNNIVYENSKTTEPYKEEHLDPEFTREIYREDVKIGEIKLICTTYYLENEINLQIMNNLLRAAFINLLIFFTIILLSKRITSSIDKIAEGVEEYSNGDRNKKIDIINSHEIKHLADRINNLFEVIETSSTELNENYKVLKEQKETLRITEERYRYAVEGSNDAVWDWNVLTGEYYVSQRGLQLIGKSENEKVDLSSWISFIHPQDKEMFENYLNHFREEPTSFGQIEVRIIDSKGDIYWLFCRGKGILNQENQLTRVSGFYTDITEHIKSEEAINRLAYYDVLTGLPNRAMLFERWTKMYIEQNQRNVSGALLYMDLDNFKTINDTKGHNVGDTILVNISEEFIKMVECDAVARIGGDEFVFIQKDSDVIRAGELANELLRVISKPWNISGYEFNVTGSIGITIYPEDGIDIDKLLMNADSAMYQAKGQGKNQFKFYEQSTNDLMVQKIELQKEILQGIRNKEFILLYQPQLDVKSGIVKGVEALVRWQHPNRGLLPPSIFISLAEETGLIIPMGEQILKTACEQSVKWEKAGFKNITMAVNFSVQQFNKKDIIRDILNIIEETGMRPELLDIEITESTAMENMEKAVGFMKNLRKNGIRFSLDDFGTGYSSLNYLSNLPINHLKIDMMFVQKIRPGNFEEVVVKAIIDIAHNMKLIVIAEGVETEEQYDTLKQLGSDIVQGYLISRPVSSEEVEKLLPNEEAK